MLPFNERTLYRAIAFTAVLTFSLLCLIVPLLNPVDNWDMLGYAASVKSIYGMNAASIHESVFSEYQLYATSRSFEHLTSDSSYKRIMYQDAEAFYQQIPFYKIRILYVLMLSAASELGYNIYAAMHFISAFFGAAAFLTIYYGMRRQVHSFVWIIAPVFYFFFSIELNIFQQGGVDTLAFFWVAITTVAFFRGSNWLYPLLAMAVLVRTDLILYVTLMYAAALYWNREHWRKSAVWIMITLALYFGVNHWSGNYGWTALINFVFASNMLATHPEQYAKDALDVRQYVGFLLRNQDWISNWFWVAIAIAVINSGIILRQLITTRFDLRTNDERLLYARKLQTISVVCLAYIILHYLLFPAIFMRFFYGQCFLCTLALLSTLSPVAQHRSNESHLHSNTHVVHS